MLKMKGRLFRDLEGKRFIFHLAFSRGKGEHLVEKIDVDFLLTNISTLKHSLLRADHDLHRQFRALPEGTCVVHETGDVPRNETIDHAAAPDRFSGKDARVDGGFGIVADDASEELHGRRDPARFVLHGNASVRVFQVAVARSGSEIDPASKVGVP